MRESRNRARYVFGRELAAIAFKKPKNLRLCEVGFTFL